MTATATATAILRQRLQTASAASTFECDRDGSTTETLTATATERPAANATASAIATVASRATGKAILLLIFKQLLLQLVAQHGFVYMTNFSESLSRTRFKEHSNFVHGQFAEMILAKYEAFGSSQIWPN